jgi:hypothetical protein
MNSIFKSDCEEIKRKKELTNIHVFQQWIGEMGLWLTSVFRFSLQLLSSLHEDSKNQKDMLDHLSSSVYHVIGGLIYLGGPSYAGHHVSYKRVPLFSSMQKTRTHSARVWWRRPKRRKENERHAVLFEQDREKKIILEKSLNSEGRAKIECFT